MIEWVRSTALAAAKPLHIRWRRQKLRVLEALVGDSAGSDSLLDVGGGQGIAGEFLSLYISFRTVTVVNVSTPQVDLTHVTDRVHRVVADGCILPFGTRTFDWVFSNAVIEHVGDSDRQRLFANEVRRVARKGYFVSTPNRSFPVEPHTFLPFYQYLSPSLQQTVVRFSPGYLRTYEDIHLLTIKGLQELFPEAQVISSGFPIIKNNLIAHFATGSH